MRRRGPLIFLARCAGDPLAVSPSRSRSRFFKPLILAGALAIVMAPLHDRIRNRVRRPGLAALLTTLMTVLLVVIPVSLVFFARHSELSDVVTCASGVQANSNGMPQSQNAHPVEWNQRPGSRRRQPDPEAVHGIHLSGLLKNSSQQM